MIGKTISQRHAPVTAALPGQRFEVPQDHGPGHQPGEPFSQLAIFLNGLINDKRGKKEEPQPEPEKLLTNNIIFRKLKIALDLKADDVLDILGLANFAGSFRTRKEIYGSGQTAMGSSATMEILSSISLSMRASVALR